MNEYRKVKGAFLQREDGQPELVLVFEDGEEIAQNIDEGSWNYWVDEGLEVREERT